MRDAIEQFRAAIKDAGLVPPETIEMDGRLRRFPSNGKHGDDAGWYVLYNDGIPAGAFGDWRIGTWQSWRADIGRTLTRDEDAAHREKVAAAKRERELEEIRRHAEAATRAKTIWDAGQPAHNDHPYLLRKQVKAHGLRVHEGALVGPVRSGDELHSLQFIAADGDKLFLDGGRIAGCYCLIGSTNADDRMLYIAEGYAIGATVHEASGRPVQWPSMPAILSQ